MRKSLFLSVCAGLTAAMGLASVASADVIATVTYADLNGNFTGTGPGTGNFNAVAVAGGLLNSSMTASRLVPVLGDAEFSPGFVAAANPANFTISINTNTITLAGTGSFAVTDVDGDTITGNIAGDWENIGGFFMAFNGTLSNVQFTGTSFDGEIGAFSTIFAGGPPFDGAIVQLTSTLSVPGGGFGAIVNAATSGTLQIVPAPGAIALLGLGGLVVSRRRR